MLFDFVILNPHGIFFKKYFFCKKYFHDSHVDTLVGVSLHDVDVHKPSYSFPLSLPRLLVGNGMQFSSLSLHIMQMVTYGPLPQLACLIEQCIT